MSIELPTTIVITPDGDEVASLDVKAWQLEPAVLAAFQGGGAGWQTRMNEALREWALDHELLPADA